MSAFTELETLWHEHHNAMVRHARIKVGPEAAEDLVQDAFCNALKAMLGDDMILDNPRAWLFRILRNRIIDHFRSRGRMLDHSLDDMLELRTEKGDPARLVEAFDAAITTDKVLTQLSEPQQQVIKMRFLGDCEFSEIAGELGKNEGAVKAIMGRGLSAANLLLGGKGRPGWGRNAAKYEAIRALLCEHGPMTIGQIHAATDLTHNMVKGIMRGNQRMFVIVGQAQKGAVTAYLWGVAGVHDKEAA